MNFYTEDKLSAAQAIFEAQKIAFAPFVFQASLTLRDLGILNFIENARNQGVTITELQSETKLPLYGIKVLLEAGLGIGLVTCREEKYFVTRLAYFILHDEMTKVNMDFVQDVNYKGFFNLKESIVSGKPEGLKEFGDWPTIYPGLSSLPEKAKKSWFAFDHYYSDIAFKQVLPIVFKDNPLSLIDVGGNTGKWALQCVQYNPEVKVTIADLPGQLRMAEINITEKGFAERVSYYHINLLNPNESLPKGNNAIWMSQFLDCFSQEQIISILNRAVASMDKDDKLYILETYWDRQKFEASAFCLQQTSLYFTCLANGNSQMYHSDDMKRCLDAAGLKIIEDIDNIGISHTLFKCVKI